MNTTNTWKFTDRLRSWTNVRRLSRRRLAARSGLDVAYVHRLVTGEKWNPSASTVLRLALGCALTAAETDELLGCAGYPPMHELIHSIF